MEAESTAFSGPIPRLSSVKDTSSIRQLDGLSVECRKFKDVLESKVLIISKDMKDDRSSKSS
ncbi:hypothetical protein YC2023_021088 [Brassica napus]